MDSIPEHLIEGLRKSDAYRDDATARGGVTEIQTHLSHVFLTGNRVYKLRKAVELGFVDFTTRGERTADCLREIHLNRRLAPDVYLGLAPVLEDARGPYVGPLADEAAGPELEHCVVMRRLPEGRDGLTLLERGELDAAVIDALGELIASFHARERLDPGRIDAPAWLDGIERAALDNTRALAEAARGGHAVADPDRVRTLAERTRDALEAARAPLAARLRAGRAVDGHGDLHLQHVWLERPDARPILIDCLEFSAALRHVDAAADVAFLAMDLGYRGRRDLQRRFLRGYAACADDYDLYPVVDLFTSYRAAVRAKVAAAVVHDRAVPEPQRRAAGESAARHLALAIEALEPRGRGALVVVCGRIGTGKSTAASALASALPGLDAVPIVSDRVRKHLAGLAPRDRARGDAARHLYSDETTERVYTGLLERARFVVSSGRVAILDATWARADQRALARDWAREHAVPVALLETRCPGERVLERLRSREAAGTDPSDAGPDLYRELADRYEPPDEWPESARFALDTDAPDWRERLESLGRSIEQLFEGV